MAQLSDEYPAALELLELLSICAAEALPLDVFTAQSDVVGEALGEAASDPVRWVRTLGALAGFSLARWEDDAVSVHRLVQSATRTRLSTSARLFETRARLLRVLRGAVPEEAPGDPAGWPRWRRLLPHVSAVVNLDDGVPDGLLANDVSWLCNAAARYLELQGQLSVAIALFGRAVTIDQTTKGSDHPDTLAARSNLAHAYLAAGRIEEAITLYERTLSDRRRVLGDSHPDIFTSRNNLAYAHRAAGRVEEAIALYEQTFADRRRVLGDSHPDTFTSRNNLAKAYERAGRVEEARNLQHEG